MGATRRDVSGLFDAELKGSRRRSAAVLDDDFHLTHKGLTFVTATYLPKWMEVGVEMRLPSKGTRRDQQIMCRGVVVQCTRRERGGGFDVALVFLDLPKRAQTRLSIHPPVVSPSSISISR